jgi:hypothetical protein
MNLYFPMEEYEARWARVERSMIDRGYDVAVVWSQSGGTFDRRGDVLYLSNYVSTESGQDQLTTARRNYLGGRCWPFSEAQITLLSVSLGENGRSELTFQR